MRNLQIEINEKACIDRSTIFTAGGNAIAVTPPLGEDFWLMRVRLSETQAIVCFPKFFTIGCGFQKEENWNTNLPLGCPPDTIYNHIKGNKGDDGIVQADCIRAIEMLQKEAVRVGALEQKEIEH